MSDKIEAKGQCLCGAVQVEATDALEDLAGKINAVNTGSSRSGVGATVASVDGIGLLPVTTRFGVEKVLAAVEGQALGQRVVGYQIHHGRVDTHGASEPWLTLDRSNGSVPDGARSGRDRLG